MHNGDEMERLTYTIDEAAALMGIGRSTAYEAAHTGQLPTIRIGRRLLVSRKGLDLLLAQGFEAGQGRIGTLPQPVAGDVAQNVL